MDAECRKTSTAERLLNLLTARFQTGTTGVRMSRLRAKSSGALPGAAPTVAAVSKQATKARLTAR